jgi:hypothetical protein
MTAPVT